jgi:hypothetical protein
LMMEVSCLACSADVRTASDHKHFEKVASEFRRRPAEHLRVSSEELEVSFVETGAGKTRVTCCPTRL